MWRAIRERRPSPSFPPRLFSPFSPFAPKKSLEILPPPPFTPLGDDMVEAIKRRKHKASRTHPFLPLSSISI